MQFLSQDDFACAISKLSFDALPLNGYRLELLEHRVAGPSLRNYIILTEYPMVFPELSINQRLWNRYYWYARFAKEWQDREGYDAGIEQSVFKLLETIVEDGGADLEQLADVDAAIERDALV